jgi:hypothetical protein
MSRVLETVRRPSDSKYIVDSRKYVALTLTGIVGMAVIMALAGFALPVGFLPDILRGPNFDIYYPFESSSPPSTTHTSSIPSYDLGSIEGIVLGSTGTPETGASVTAQKNLGFVNSVVQEGGYIANTYVSVDGTYSLKAPSGAYKITVVFSDGTSQTIENYAVWPSSSSSYDFKKTKSLPSL